MSPPHNYPSATPQFERQSLKNLRAVFPYLWKFRARVLTAIGCLVLAKVATVLVPLVLKQIVDALDPAQHSQLVLPVALLLGYGALRLCTTAFNELRDSIFARVRYNTMRRLSLEVLAHLHRLALRYHLERKTGGISRDLERGTQSFSSILNYLAFSMLPTAAEVLMVGSILLFYYDASFALVTFGAVVVYASFTILVTEWRMKFRHSMNTLDSRANNQAFDSLINYETVKYFNNEEFESRRYDGTLGEWERDAVRSQTSMSALNVGQGAIIAVCVTVIMLLASRGVVRGEMTLGDLVLVNAFLLQLFLPLNYLGIVYRQLKYAMVDMDRMLQLLGEPVEIEDAVDAPDLHVGDGAVTFEHVNFSYVAERPILRDVHFHIEPGQKVAVVGPSGAGKSTLARLLFRFYDVSSGRVLVNAQDVRDVRQASLRDAIGIVPQDTVMFNDTIYYNIAYARPGASRESVMRVANLAHIHTFIESLPNGYNTIVGERGLKLSGGEKQRVAIARVILKDPKVLIFDEATSALDSESEQEIQNSLAEVAARHTTLVIAHRLSTVIDADEILVLDQGRIVERGTHRKLLQLAGLYARMWTLQQEERDSADTPALAAQR